VACFVRGRWLLVTVALAGMAGGACGTGSRAPVFVGGRAVAVGSVPTPTERARAGERPAWTRADVEFMTGMIPHHAQAVLMAGWAESHGAGASIRILCRRIVVAQRDEIATMQNWLRERGERVPDADPSHMLHGSHDGNLMPGMLTAAQLAELDGARGADFDRLFLRFMILHHEGALVMVERLFAAVGAAQDEDVFKLASDIHADQTTEIEHMGKMLAAMTGGGQRQ
jgi:uncharacterized protein (DUF305 family)